MLSWSKWIHWTPTVSSANSFHCSVIQPHGHWFQFMGFCQMIAHQMLDIFLGNWEKSILLLGYSNKHFREPLYSEIRWSIQTHIFKTSERNWGHKKGKNQEKILKPYFNPPRFSAQSRLIKCSFVGNELLAFLRYMVCTLF